MATKRSMITIATDAGTKERVRRYAQAAGVDVTTYVSAAIGEAMRRDDLVARTFAPLDALIEDAERVGDAVAWPPENAEQISQAESDSIDRALDAFFGATRGDQGVA